MRILQPEFIFKDSDLNPADLPTMHSSGVVFAIYFLLVQFHEV